MKAALDQLARSPSAPPGLVQRSRIVLAAAAGRTNQQIADELQMPEVTVSKWRRCFASQGLEGLQDAPRSGRPAKHGPEIVQRVQNRACQQPEHQSRWSVRTLAQDLRLPRSTVHQILVTADLQPHRVRSFTFSPDPDFAAKRLEIVGLYLNPPQNALLLCSDEKPGIQALEPPQLPLPLSARKPRNWTNESLRDGTQTLWAALEIASGRVAQVKRGRTSVNFLRFLQDVVEAFPEQNLHMLLDHLQVRNNQAAQRCLKLHPRLRFYDTPTHASWVNMVECFFSILGPQGSSRAVPISKRPLKEFLLDYIAQNDQNPRPFVWTKGREQLQPILEATKEYPATHPRTLTQGRRRRPARNTTNN
jgi:transposase